MRLQADSLWRPSKWSIKSLNSPSNLATVDNLKFVAKIIGRHRFEKGQKIASETLVFAQKDDSGMSLLLRLLMTYNHHQLHQHILGTQKSYENMLSKMIHFQTRIMANDAGIRHLSSRWIQSILKGMSRQERYDLEEWFADMGIYKSFSKQSSSYLLMKMQDAQVFDQKLISDYKHIQEMFLGDQTLSPITWLRQFKMTSIQDKKQWMNTYLSWIERHEPSKTLVERRLESFYQVFLEGMAKDEKKKMISFHLMTHHEKMEWVRQMIAKVEMNQNMSLAYEMYKEFSKETFAFEDFVQYHFFERWKENALTSYDKMMMRLTWSRVISKNQGINTNTYLLSDLRQESPETFRSVLKQSLTQLRERDIAKYRELTREFRMDLLEHWLETEQLYQLPHIVNFSATYKDLSSKEVYQFLKRGLTLFGKAMERETIVKDAKSETLVMRENYRLAQKSSWIQNTVEEWIREHRESLKELVIQHRPFELHQTDSPRESERQDIQKILYSFSTYLETRDKNESLVNTFVRTLEHQLSHVSIRLPKSVQTVYDQVVKDQVLEWQKLGEQTYRLRDQDREKLFVQRVQEHIQERMQRWIINYESYLRESFHYYQESLLDVDIVHNNIVRKDKRINLLSLSRPNTIRRLDQWTFLYEPDALKPGQGISQTNYFRQRAETMARSLFVDSRTSMKADVSKLFYSTKNVDKQTRETEVLIKASENLDHKAKVNQERLFQQDRLIQEVKTQMKEYSKQINQMQEKMQLQESQKIIEQQQVIQRVMTTLQQQMRLARQRRGLE